MRKDINIVVLVKGAERYIFLFNDDNRIEALRQLGKFAANPELSFTWLDAAATGKRIREATIEPPSERTILPIGDL